MRMPSFRYFKIKMGGTVEDRTEVKRGFEGTLILLAYMPHFLCFKFRSDLTC